MNLGHWPTGLQKTTGKKREDSGSQVIYDC